MNPTAGRLLARELQLGQCTHGPSDVTMKSMLFGTHSISPYPSNFNERLLEVLQAASCEELSAGMKAALPAPRIGSLLAEGQA